MYLPLDACVPLPWEDLSLTAARIKAGNGESFRGGRCAYWPQSKRIIMVYSLKMSSHPEFCFVLDFYPPSLHLFHLLISLVYSSHPNLSLLWAWSGGPICQFQTIADGSASKNDKGMMEFLQTAPKGQMGYEDCSAFPTISVFSSLAHCREETKMKQRDFCFFGFGVNQIFLHLVLEQTACI